MERARADGLESGRAAAREEVAAALEALREALAGLTEHRARIEDDLVREATAMAIETAAKLVRAEVAARPERVGDVLRGAIRRAADRSRLMARVSPGDLATCRALAPVILAEMGGIGALEIVDDPRIGPGSCVLETSGGDVDATFPEPAVPRDGRALRPARPVARRARRAVSGVDLADGFRRLRALDPYRLNGRVTQLIGLVVESKGPEASIGERCEILTPGHRTGSPPLQAEVVGFREGRTLLMPLGDAAGVGPGQTVVATGTAVQVGVGEGLLGRVVDGLGRPVDGLPAPALEGRRSIDAPPPDVLGRPTIRTPLPLGVRAIDTLMPCGSGQRMGIFAGSGVGKSTLMGMMARGSSADVNVIALVGERGREVREFIEHDLGPEGLARSVLVVATSDQPALVRIKAAFVATTIAEFFRDRGADVLLMMDSVTRLATAQREVGLAIGEPPATRGYTPSVFAMLPRLLERAGTAPVGSITALYTVLVEGDDMNEPVADAVRSDPRRPHRPLAGSRPPPPLPGHRRPAVGVPPHVPAAHPRASGGRRPPALPAGRAPPGGRPDRHRRLRGRLGCDGQRGPRQARGDRGVPAPGGRRALRPRGGLRAARRPGRLGGPPGR